MTIFPLATVNLRAPVAFKMAQGIDLPIGFYIGTVAASDDGAPQPRYLLTLDRDQHATFGATFLERGEQSVTYDVTRHVELGNFFPE